MGSFFKKHSRLKFNRYLWILLAIFSVYLVAILNFVLIEQKSFQDAFLESACTSLYVDCSGASLSTKIVHVLLGLSTMAGLVVIISAGVDVFLNDIIGGRSMKKQISSLKNHFIVCGYGALGKTVCAELNANKKSFVVIDSNEKLVEHLLS
ncbi:NAD-binding protein [Candidatus Micrarchaeota archaeon]|nr:NAD-binding protein [Candidatus Micrarchaeota archaeon]